MVHKPPEGAPPITLRFARLADTVNIIVQLLLGALLVAGIDVWFISRAVLGYATQPPWLIVVIPVGATVLWIVGATVALHFAIQQRGHADSADESSSATAHTD